MSSIRHYAFRHSAAWILSVFLSAGAVLCNLYIPRLLGSAIDEVQRGQASKTALGHFALLMLLVASCSWMLHVLLMRLEGRTSRTIAHEIRRDLFRQLALLEAAYFQGVRTGDVLARFIGDVGEVELMLGFGLLQGLNAVLVLGLTLWMVMRLSPELGRWVFYVLPLVGGLVLTLLRVMGRRYAQVQADLSDLSARAQENFSGAKVVKGYVMEEQELRTYRKLNESYRRSVLYLSIVESPLWAGLGLMMNGIFAVVLFVGAKLLLSGGRVGGLSLGGFITFVIYLFQLNWPILSIGVVLNAFQRGMVSWRRIEEILRRAPAIADGLGTDRSIEDLRGDVRFENVSVEIRGRLLLAGVSMHVPRGRVVGVTGKSGAGKSLLVAMLTRQLEPTSGRVLIDGHDIRTIPLAVLRRHLGVVLQDPFLFSGTLSENIAFGTSFAFGERPDSKNENEIVEWASRLSELHADVLGFPDKYETVVGERGVTLSGGQRQRAALARALVTKAPIMVLDDSFSAVDVDTEARILANLRTTLGGSTMILTAHRVSTLRRADEIVVLDDGRLVEQGSHEVLISLNGHYAAMERRQRLATALASSL